MKLYFARHGSTLMNELNKGQGWLDSDLTDRGIDELHKLYKNIDLPKFDSAYSSDLNRTVKTLKIIKEYNQLSSDNIFNLKDLRERFLGSFEGDNLDKMQLYIAQKKGYESYIDYQKENNFIDYINDNHELDPNGYAEDFKTFKKRVLKAFNQIKNESIKNNWENILIVAHQNSIRLIQHLILQKTTGFEREKLANGELLVFSYENDEWEQIKNDK